MATTGLNMYTQQRFQMVPETTAGVPDATKAIEVLTMFKADRKPEDVYDSQRPQGFNEEAWTALLRSHSVISGPIKPDFGQMDFICYMLAGNPVSDTSLDGIRTRVYQIVDSGPRSIVPKTLEYGTLQAGKRCPYGVLQALSLKSARDGLFQGDVTMFARKPNPDGDVPLSADSGILGTDLTTGVTATGTSTTPAHLCDNDVSTTTTFVTTQTGIVDLGTAKTVIGVRLTKGATSGHTSGVLKLQGSADGSFDDTVDLWSITNTSDANWPVLTQKQRIFSNLNGYQHLRLLYTTSSGNLLITELELFDAPGLTNSAVTIPAAIPILPLNMSIRRASTLGGLDDAVAMLLVNEIGLSVADLANPTFFADENNMTFIEHVDGEAPKQTLSAMVASNENDADQIAMFSDSRAQPATPEWYRTKWAHPDAIHAMWIDQFASIAGVIPYSSRGNIYQREFPFTPKINGNGWVWQITTQVAA